MVNLCSILFSLIIMNSSLMNSLCFFAQEKDPEIRTVRICAAVVHKHKDIIALGFPRRKTHTLMQTYSKNHNAIFLHAEIDALTRAIRVFGSPTFDDRQFSLYVARIKRRGSQDLTYTMGLSKPCAGCMNFIDKCGIRTIHWTHG